ncbi:Hypothetical predicted protein [Olea europaea subsp. europaea]|uniref:Uncharacterized protein n=1 Tax=Olea europaea subsp. europaea TaxID=158383 RepID=A0A8S0TGE7_OLEEU|nr:Hypothetical predicted protein [Olea europaea subsp. europaea]
MESTSFNATETGTEAMALNNGLESVAFKLEQQKSSHEPFFNAFFRQLSKTMELFVDKNKGQILKLVKHDWLYTIWADWLGFVDFYMASNPKFVAASAIDNNNNDDKTIENFVRTTKKFLDSVLRSPKTKNCAARWTYPLYNLNIDLSEKKTFDFASLSSILFVDNADKFISDVQARIGEDVQQLYPFRFVQRLLFNHERVLLVAADRTYDGDDNNFITRTYVTRILPAVLRGEITALGPINNNVVDKYEDCIRRVVAFFVEAKANDDGTKFSPSKTTIIGHGSKRSTICNIKRNKSNQSLSTEKNETTTTVVEESNQAAKVIRNTASNDIETISLLNENHHAANAAYDSSIKTPSKIRSKSKKRATATIKTSLSSNDEVGDEPPEKLVCTTDSTKTTSPICPMTTTVVTVPSAQIPPPLLTMF